MDAAISCEHVYRDDGLTSSPPAGSRRWTGRIRPWPSSWARAATPRRASSPTTWYCASDSGLDRGFAAYHDYIFPRLTAFKPAVLVDRTVEGLQAIERFLEDRLDIDLLRPAVQQLWWLFNADRKEAAVVNREFLDWLSRRRQPDRPFFAFLNYFDAHYPYRAPARWHPPVRGRAARHIGSRT